MRCAVCGAEYAINNASFCPCCGAPLGWQPDFAAGINEQQIYQLEQAVFSYCKVMRVPKLGVAPVVITVLEGVVITLIMLAVGVKLLSAIIIGAVIFAVFAFICWLIYRLRVGASKRLNTYIAADGGRRMFYDFASAQPFADDQFRLGSEFLFIKNGAVIRLEGVTDVVRVISHYHIIPTGVQLSVLVDDEHGSMAFPLCRVHMLKAGAEIDEIYKAVMQRRDLLRGANR